MVPNFINDTETSVACYQELLHLTRPNVRETRRDRNECTKRYFRSDFSSSKLVSIIHSAPRMKKVIMNNLVQSG